MICMSFAIAYLWSESFSDLGKNVDTGNKSSFDLSKNLIVPVLKALIGLVFSEKTLVSALEASDLDKGVYTCTENKAGQYCQSYAASDCIADCKGTCLAGKPEETEQCKIGTCFDNTEGTCATGSPKYTCEQNNGTWFDDKYGNVKQCQKGCCSTQYSTFFATSKRCSRLSQLMGAPVTFNSEITSEQQCLSGAPSIVEGACIYKTTDLDLKNSCKFVTKSECIAMKGQFSPGYLCSNPELNTNCEKQAKTGCIEGKDEVYWIDSCGNQENIYDINKDKSWNNGLVITKNDSCILSDGKNPLANQANCGNCYRLAGSKCNTPDPKKDAKPAIGNVVCGDLSCIDKFGNKRYNGESWCEYQGVTGVHSKGSADTPGSTQFRSICIDGKVQTAPCDDFRNYICTESQIPITAERNFSVGTCRMNMWQECIEINGKDGKLDKGESKKCAANPDCFVKDIHISESLYFETCLPRYAPGFDMVTEAGQYAANKLCKMASISCVSYWVKKANVKEYLLKYGLQEALVFGGMGTGASVPARGEYMCVANCECETPAFAETVNNFCMSLGDCGYSVNYLGMEGNGAKVTTSLNHVHETTFVNGAYNGFYTKIPVPSFTRDYINTLRSYSKTINGSYIDSKDVINYSYKYSPSLASVEPTDFELNNQKLMESLSGAGMIATTIAESIIAGTAGSYVLGGVPIIGSIISSMSFQGTVHLINTYLGISAPWAGAVIGAILGFAAAYMLISRTGIAPGVPQELIYGFLGAATIAGGILGYNAGTVLAGSVVSSGYAAAGWVALIILAVIVIIILVLDYADIGDVKKNLITFQCKPWPAPPGGKNCDKCGSDGYPCNVYACQSLGTTCRFLNEGTSSAECTNIAPNDVSSPVITPMQSLFDAGLTFEKTDNGMKLKSSSGDGCVGANSVVKYGISLNEPGQCMYDNIHTDNMSEMSFDFDDEGIYLSNHTSSFLVPSLESLGVSSVNQNARADYSVYVRCADYSGNENVQEFAVDMCVKPGVDSTPPVINARDPVIDYIPYGATSQNMSIWTNEPADCNWDTTDKDYNSMANNFSCANEFSDAQPLGWQCDTTFPVPNIGGNFYVRCKDQPWLAGTNDSARNANMQSYLITLKKSSSPLIIDYTFPADKDVFKFNVNPATVNITVRTSGGMNGEATCYYTVDNTDILFFETGKRIHQQSLMALTPGKKKFDIKCTDDAGNVAKKSITFDVMMDNSAPKVTKSYLTGSVLNIITDEDAQCNFITALNESEGKSNPCSFDFDSGTIMYGTDTSHSVNFDQKKTYYIKCEDFIGNIPGGCSTIIRYGENGGGLTNAAE